MNRDNKGYDVLITGDGETHDLESWLDRALDDIFGGGAQITVGFSVEGGSGSRQIAGSITETVQPIYNISVGFRSGTSGGGGKIYDHNLIPEGTNRIESINKYQPEARVLNEIVRDLRAAGVPSDVMRVEEKNGDLEWIFDREKVKQYLFDLAKIILKNGWNPKKVQSDLEKFLLKEAWSLLKELGPLTVEWVKILLYSPNPRISKPWEWKSPPSMNPGPVGPPSTTPTVTPTPTFPQVPPTLP